MVPDPFLSPLLGKNAFHMPSSCAADEIAAMTADVATPAFVDAKVPVADISRMHAFEDAGFRLVDTNVQLLCSDGIRPHAAPQGAIRFATPADRGQVRTLAARSFSQDRFHADPLIADSTADAIKKAWADNFFAGSRGDWMVVAETDGRIVGFAQLLRHPQQGVVIDLIGVDGDARGRGFGRSMLSFASLEIGPSMPFHVGTQLQNTGSIDFYRQTGFRMISAAHVVHRHLTRHS